MTAVSEAPFGLLPDGRETRLYTLQNARGTSVALSDYGARIVRLSVPDRAGAFGDVALGYDSVSGYLEYAGGCYGAVCGRVANRIRGGAFRLHGVDYSIGRNIGAHTLHGGILGFDQKLFSASPAADGVCFSLHSPDGDEGFPGNLALRVTCALTDGDALVIRYRAESDRDTPLNLTNHAYWNLAGHGAGSVLAHTLALHADAFLPVDASLIPTGERRPVRGTRFDFTAPHALGERIGENDPQLALAGGYDHCFILSSPRAAVLACPETGRGLAIETTMPGVQLYTGNSIPVHAGKGGAAYFPRCAVCLETQQFPNAVNEPSFPDSLLYAGKPSEYETKYQFFTY